MKILVTGGAGFIGSHLCERLLSDGHEVTALDSFSTGSISNLDNSFEKKGFTFVEGSILDVPKLNYLVKKSDYIFHLAAAVGVFNIVHNPIESLLANIRGTENVLEAAHKADVPVFLTSSSEVYGKNNTQSIRETDDRVLGSPTILRWSYSEAKAIGESLCYAYFVEKGLQVRIVRFFNTVGPRQLGNYGMVVPRFVSAAIANEPITIYGTGLQTRCFAHVLDVIDAVVGLAFAPNAIGKAVNIGNSVEISMNDLANEIIQKTNSKSKIVHVPYLEAYGDGFEDMDRRIPNIDLINELIGWKPKRDLSNIISDIALEMKRRARVS